MAHNHFRGALTPSPEVSLSRVAGRNLVFSSTRQKVYELNDTAAEVWRSLHDGRAPRSIVERLVKEGHAPASADGFVSSMLAEWNRLGIRPPLQKLVRSCANERLRQSIDLTGLRICLRFRMPQAQASSQIFEHLAVDGQSHDVTFDIVNRGRECHLYRNRQWIDACSCEGLAPVLKGRLMTEVLQGDTHVLALHAATLAFRRRLLLLCGRPGAGKSTLTLALAHAGFGFASDDLALLHTDGKVSGVPFAAAVKSGSWPLVAELWPRLLHAPVFVRGDGKRVRYVVPHAINSPGAKPVGWVVLLRRERNADVTLAPIDFSEALEGLLAGAYADRERLTTTGFAALITAVAKARCFRLVYANLNDAVRTLQRACQ